MRQRWKRALNSIPAGRNVFAVSNSSVPVRSSTRTAVGEGYDIDYNAQNLNFWKCQRLGRVQGPPNEKRNAYTYRKYWDKLIRVALRGVSAVWFRCSRKLRMNGGTRVRRFAGINVTLLE